MALETLTVEARKALGRDYYSAYQRLKALKDEFEKLDGNHVFGIRSWGKFCREVIGVSHYMVDAYLAADRYIEVFGQMRVEGMNAKQAKLMLHLSQEQLLQLASAVPDFRQVKTTAFRHMVENIKGLETQSKKKKRPRIASLIKKADALNKSLEQILPHTGKEEDVSDDELLKSKRLYDKACKEMEESLSTLYNLVNLMLLHNHVLA